MAKTLDIFNPAAPTAPAPGADDTRPDVQSHPEIRRKAEPRSIRQQFLFTASLLEKLNAASMRLNASKNSIVCAALERYLKELEK